MKYFLIPFIVLLMSCSSSPKLIGIIDESDYIKQQPYAEKWVGGAPGSNSGTNLYIPTDMIGGPVKIKEVLYNNMITEEVTYTDMSKGVIVAKFQNPAQDTKMTASTKEEYGNEVPDSLKNTDGEAVIKFTYDNQEYSVTIPNIKQKAVLPYPSMPGDKQSD